MPEDPGTERILRGAIVLELNLASRYANEVANRELRAAGETTAVYALGGVEPKDAECLRVAGAAGVLAMESVFGATDLDAWLAVLR